MMWPCVHPESVLLVTLDSCRYDTFAASLTPVIRQIGPVLQAWAPSHFTYGSHAAMFMGFLPSIREAIPILNSKYAKLFRLSRAGWRGKDLEVFHLDGPSIISGFSRLGYHCFGTGAVAWFDPNTETGQRLITDFDDFYYPGSCWQLHHQLQWLMEKARQCSDRPFFAFLNIGETHVPYWHQGAPWDQDDNPCIPFQSMDRRHDCFVRQRLCLEWVDQQLTGLIQSFDQATIVLTADHGDCWGEDGLWEHGVSHPCTLQVPLLMRVRGQPVSVD